VSGPKAGCLSDIAKGREKNGPTHAW